MLDGGEPIEDRRLVTPMIACLHIDYSATDNGGAGRRDAQDETVASCQHSRATETHLYPRALSWLQLFDVEQAYTRQYFLRPTVKIHQCVVSERAGSVSQQLDMGIDEHGWAKLAG